VGNNAVVVYNGLVHEYSETRGEEEIIIVYLYDKVNRQFVRFFLHTFNPKTSRIRTYSNSRIGGLWLASLVLPTAQAHPAASGTSPFAKTALHLCLRSRLRGFRIVLRGRGRGSLSRGSGNSRRRVILGERLGWVNAGRRREESVSDRHQSPRQVKKRVEDDRRQVRSKSVCARCQMYSEHMITLLSEKKKKHTTSTDGEPLPPDPIPQSPQAHFETM
jgi:hypothetical protein